MPKPRRQENKPLPKGWRWKNGAYRYRVPAAVRDQWNGQSEFKLGATLAEAYRTWAEHMELRPDEIRTMGQLMDRYLLEVVPAKAAKTQQSDQLAINRLRPVFGAVAPSAVKAPHAYKYRDAALQKGRGHTSTRHDVATLRHMLSKAVEWGVIDENPLLKHVRLEKAAPRDRLVEPWEIAATLAMKARDGRSARAIETVQLYIQFKLMTGLRRGDILRLRIADLKDDGIHCQPSKTRKSSGKRLIIEWDEAGELRRLVDRIQAMAPARIGMAPLFVTRKREAYIKEDGTANAFDSLWQRFMDRVLEDTAVSDRFQERDLRAATASYSDTLEEASERLAHSSTAITQRVYRRRPVRVQPLLRGWKKAE